MMNLALAVLLAQLLFAQSQPPSPTPPKATQENQNKATPKEAEADSNKEPSRNPSSLGKLPSVNQQDASAKSYEKFTYTWWPIVASALNLLFTARLVRLMYLQWRSMEKQAEYMRDGLAATKQAVEAATKSADAAEAASKAAEAQLSLMQTAADAQAQVLSATLDAMRAQNEATLSVASAIRTGQG